MAAQLSGSTRMRRLVAIAAIAAAMTLAGAQGARAEDPAPADASVTIAPSDGGAGRPLALADLAGRFDVHGATYTLRAADGTTSAVTVADGISLTALLSAAGLDADAFTYLEVARADGSSAIVLRDDLGGSSEGPPVVWADAQGVHLLRPSAGEQDANADDLVTVADGALAIALRTGEPLVPRIAVSTLRARPRERIDFSASLAAGRLGPGMDFQWYFDGTGTVLGANVSHRFPRPDTYLVLLNVVRGDGTSIGSPATVRIHVVRPREQRSDGARRSDDARGGSGGSGSGGTGGGGAGAGQGGAGGSDGGAGKRGAGVGALPPPVVPPPAAGAAPATAAPALAHTRRAPARVPRPRGNLVSGTLIASASAAATPANGGQAARAAARDAATDGPLHVPVGVWVALGLALLLALGWALESRYTLPFWQP